MRTKALTLMVATSALLLAACSSSGSSTATTGPTTAPVSIPSATDTSNPGSTDSAASTGTGPSGVPVSLDPCQLLTQSEASALSGVTYPAGKESTDNNGAFKECVYSTGTRSVTVEVAQAQSAADAQTAYAQAQARVQQELKQQLPAGIPLPKVNITNVSGLGDKATALQVGGTVLGRTFGISGIYVIKGATFVAFQDLSIGAGPSASQSAMVAQATTTVGRVP
jgi:hypothetical protein